MKFRKKSVVIEAVQWTGGNFTKVFEFCKSITRTKNRQNNLIIFTLKGGMVASIGDYIIKGVKGGFYPCKLDIFKATYEAVKD